MNFRKALPLCLLALAFFTPEAGALEFGRHGHTTTLLPDGNFIVLGGATGAGNAPTVTGEIYFTSAAAFGKIPDMAIARSSHTATLMGNGMLLVTGGFAAGVPLNSGAVYNPLTKAWTPVTDPMVSARGGHTATLINKGSNSGKVLICGGQTGTGPTTITNTCEVFTPNTATPALGTFDAVQPMSSERLGHSASAISEGRVFVAGGTRWDVAAATFTYLPTTEIYDPENGEWQTTSNLTQGRTDHSAVVLNNGTIMIAGGYNRTNKIDSPEEYWYKTYHGMVSNQRPGNKGYLDSAEIFSPSGAKMYVTGEEFQVMPYRVSRHSAVLTPDGKHHMYGGYGNIPPTFFLPTLELESGSRLDATAVTITTATVDPTSIIAFLLKTELVRPVSGRLVDADLFLSGPPDSASPSITVANASIYLGHSTATVDGSPVGKITTGVGPGGFKDILSLLNPTGLAVFKPTAVTSDSELATGGTLTPNPNPILPQSVAAALVPASSNITLQVTIEVPALYNGGTIAGVLTITNASVENSLGFWNATLTGGSGNFSGVASIDPLTGKGTVTDSVTFGSLAGTIINSTTTSLGAGGTAIVVGGSMVSGLSLSASYTSTLIDLSEVGYSVDTSTFMVREMIFADNVQYSPEKVKWGFGPVLYPVFNQSTLLTPAADAVILGGRNCEADPDNDCARNGASVFTAEAGAGIFISQNYSKWPETGKLAGKRAFHTSTILPNNKTLTCGGSDGNATLASCELFDMGSRTWKPAGAMNYPRARHTATLLPNGRVLAAGGEINSSTHSVKYAEIYYPDTDKWIMVSSMVFARSNHTATLLPDGNVLMAGGDTINGYSNTSELFISSSTYWNTVGNLATGGRAEHTATLLKNGNVLITGGTSGTGAVRTTELYNFASRTWTNTGNDLVVKRYRHTANLLMDGRVMVSGGTDGDGPMDTAEIYTGTQWYLTHTVPGSNKMLAKRSNHRSTLLPNGKLLVTGGEAPGLAYSLVEGYDVDFSTWQAQGETTNRVGHTTVLTSSCVLLAIGGWNGSEYLDTTEMIYYSYSPDGEGYPTQTPRLPVISTGPAIFDRGERVTLLSDTSSFHGITEASGGGAGSMNSSFHNPRIYLQQIDNPSGFLTDMTTRLYTTYGSPNTDWAKTVSSITFISPPGAGEMPYGWYHARIAANGQFSAGLPIQVSLPRPDKTPGIPTGSVLGISSISWNWTNGTVTGSADGYSLYSSSNNVFITTAAFVIGNTAFTQAGLQPNTAAAIKVNVYNVGGSGPLAESTTYYTLASTPSALTVTEASFTTAKLTWGSINSPGTMFEVSMCAGSNFTDPILISTPVPYYLSLTTTTVEVDRLSADVMYYFRVTAKNGAGISTQFSNVVSTLTVSSIGTLTGTALSSSSISWGWVAATGLDIFYQVYDIMGGTVTPVYLGSTTYTNYTQSGLLTNYPYKVAVRAVKINPVEVYGPTSYSSAVFTLAVPPSADPVNPFTEISTGSFTANWVSNGNSTWTVYAVEISSSDVYSSTGTKNLPTVGYSKNFPGLKASQRYFVKVSATNGDGITTDSVPLGSKYTWARVPTDVKPATISISGVTVTWSQNENSGETAYELRKTTGSFFGVELSTPIPFALLYTSSSHTMNGLLTSTTYYFDVTAMNGEGVLSARVQAVPAAFTTPGPIGAPAGSIGGTSDPSKLVTISGTLPNNRQVTLAVPAGSFATATSIAISSSISNACSYQVGSPLRPVEVAIFSENSLQPQEPVTLTLSYDSDESAIISANKARLVIARYNPVSGQCLPLETVINENSSPRTITATLNHFSVFQLMLRPVSTTLSDVLVYPNPFYTNRGNGFVTIANLPASAKLRIYTLSGDKVWEGTAATTGIIIWRGVNKAGHLVASGVYLAVIDSSAGKKVLKLAVER